MPSGIKHHVIFENIFSSENISNNPYITKICIVLSFPKDLRQPARIYVSAPYRQAVGAAPLPFYHHPSYLKSLINMFCVFLQSQKKRDIFSLFQFLSYFLLSHKAS